jgi:hypothetical protein
VVYRGEPEASCSEWHGDGTAAEDDRASHLVAEAPAHGWVRPVQVGTSLVGKRPEGARQQDQADEPACSFNR